MKWLIQSAMIFFGTLMAAGVVALGEPAKPESALNARATPTESRGLDKRAADTRSQRGRTEFSSRQQGFQLR